MGRRIHLGLACSIAVLSLLATAGPAAGSETIGRLAPAPSVSCAGSTVDFLQPTVTSGTGYVVPSLAGASALVISSWRHNAAPTAVGPLTLKVYRQTAAPATYTAVAHDTQTPTRTGINAFQTNLPVQPGDVIGTTTAAPATSACTFSDPGQTALLRLGNLADGESGAFTPGGADKSVNVSAVVSPSNTFTLSKNYAKKNGTGTIFAVVPNPGALVTSGKGVKAGGPRTATAPGTVTIPVRAQGKKRKKLVRTGAVKVKANVTYTPTGGSPRAGSLTLKLLLKR
jgi:hypothetical protein